MSSLAEIRAEISPRVLLVGLSGAILTRALVTLARSWAGSRSPPVNLPRGPTPIPIFGNALSLKDDDAFLDQLLEMERDYGPVFSLYLGRKLTVVVNGLEMIRQVVLGGLDFGDRSGDSLYWQEFNPNRLGIFETEANESWKKQRKFAQTTLRKMSFGKVQIEPVVQEEVRSLIEHLKAKGGNGINPMTSFGVSTSNVISRLVIQRRLDHDSKTADEFVTNLKTLMLEENSDTAFMVFPWLWYLIKHTHKWRVALRAGKFVYDFLYQEISVRQKRIDAAQGDPEICDFIDAYLVHRKEDPQIFSLEALCNVILDLFLAGTDTSATTLTWAAIYLASKPSIQQKIHEEIIGEIGESEVSMTHRSSLPYTQAALLEVQRLASLVPLIPRRSAKDTELGGYTIPKGTDVLVNLWSLHHDPQVWPEPMVFKPERFLDEDGHLKQTEHFLPFSAGKRNCMGEQLAKMELFLFFASMVQQLEFSLPPGCPAPSYDGTLGIVRQPYPFQIKVTPRSA